VEISGQKIQKTVLEQFKYQNSETIIVKTDLKNKNKDNPISKVENLIILLYKKILTSKLYNTILDQLIKITDF
jgi:hypothetical protein